MLDSLIIRDDDVPVGIEVKVISVSAFSNTAKNRTSELLASAVEIRRAFRGEIALVAVLLLRDDARPTGKGTGSDPLRGMLPRLSRADDGVGFDLVLVGSVADDALGKVLRWVWYPGSHSDIDTALASTHSTEEALARVRGLSPTHPRSPAAVSSRRRRRALLVADEWRSGSGGISTVNRELAIALAAAEVDAAVMVPEASEDDLRSASEAEVSLVTPARIPGLNDREALLLRPISSEPEWEPDFIVGHGRVLGAYAAAQQQQFFPRAKRIHFVHTDAEQLESAKEYLGGPSRMSTADERRKLERDLASSAHLIAGVGPLLAESMSDQLIGQSPQARVVCFLPGLRAGIDFADSPPPIRNRVLLLGRAEDFQSKGIDIVADALLRVVDEWPVSRSHRPSLLVRGVAPSYADEVKANLDRVFEGRVEYSLRPYSDSEDELVQDLGQSKVLVMPSRHEGFGLSAYEAIASGTPVLISAESGLAQLLRASGIDTEPTSVVSTRNSASRLASDVWADALTRILDVPEQSRAEAIALREAIRGVTSWRASVDSLLAELDRA